MKEKHAKVLVLVAILGVSMLLMYADVSIAQPAALLESIYVDGPLPVTDPASLLWAQATPVEVPLAGQGTTAPVRLQASTPNVQVRSLSNGTHIAFQVSWSDETLNNRTTLSQQFRDAMAIMFADSTLPGICMGSRGQLVHIVQWKADWQADIDEGFRDLQHAYPNFWVDHYPYAIGEPPYKLPEAFPGAAKDLLVGWAVGNPFSDPVKVTPVEDGLAQGFGTITTQDRQDVLGRGTWSGNRWSVVISRRLNTGDAEDLELVPGTQYYLGMAVWDGAEGDVGARKSVTSWMTFEVAPVPGFAPLYLWALVAIPPAVAAIFIWYIVRGRRGA